MKARPPWFTTGLSLGLGNKIDNQLENSQNQGVNKSAKFDIETLSVGAEISPKLLKTYLLLAIMHRCSRTMLQSDSFTTTTLPPGASSPTLIFPP